MILRTALLFSLIAWGSADVGAQSPGAARGGNVAIQKVGPALYRIGAITIDTTKREVSVAGTINDVRFLEWVANARDGMKAYESAISLDTDAVAFNAALLLVGLDRAHARVPTVHFDPKAPEGDRVGLFVEWMRGSEHRRVPIEQLLFDKVKQQVIPESPWVYTGSSFLPDGRFRAALDGVLIGFVHSPSPLIESVGGAGVRRFGEIAINPNLGLAPETPVTLIVKALGAAGAPR